MRFRVSLMLASLTALAASPAMADIQITVDKTSQTLTVARDGAVLHKWPVSTGRVGRFTPSGTHQAFRMEKDHYSQEFDDAPMPYSIFFTKRGHAIHGSYDTKKLGRPASGGCVRLAPENARVLFDLVKAEGVLKTKVTIAGDERIALARAERPSGQANQAGTRNAERAATYSPPVAEPRQSQRYAIPREAYAAPQERAQQPQYFYDGYQWRAYPGQTYSGEAYQGQAYRVQPQPYQRGYQQPQYYYQQPRYYYD